MTTITATHNIVEETIKKELEASNQLLTLLEQENSALNINDIETVHSLSENKKQLIEIIQYLDKQRNDLIRQAGFSADKEGTEKYLKQYKPDSHPLLNHNWQHLLDIADQCHRQNSINGKIIFSNLRYTKRALSILRGQNEETSLRYGSNGETVSINESSSLAKA